MRLIVIKQAFHLQTPSIKFLKKPVAGRGDAKEVSQAKLGQLKQLNPHVDFQRLEASTVLLLPDSPELNNRDSQSLGGDAFEDFVAYVGKGFNAAAQRMGLSADALAADRSAVKATLEIAAVKRTIESDPLLQKQLDEANREFADAQKKAQDAAGQVDTMQNEMDAELKALRKMLTR